MMGFNTIELDKMMGNGNSVKQQDSDGMPIYPNDVWSVFGDFFGIGNSARQANYQAQLAR